MTTSDLLEHINQKPFQSFAIATTDNRLIQVDHQLDLKIYKRKRKKPVRCDHSRF
jgi:hypothetical protein